MVQEMQAPIVTIEDEKRWTTRLNTLLKKNQNAISTLRWSLPTVC